jgi:endonuclease-8
MVEGPGVHRVALVHRRMLQGRVFQATSPSGRFVDGAAAINGHVLSHIEAHAKNIFYNQRRLQVRHAQKDAEGEMMV